MYHMLSHIVYVHFRIFQLRISIANILSTFFSLFKNETKHTYSIPKRNDRNDLNNMWLIDSVQNWISVPIWKKWKNITDFAVTADLYQSRTR